MVARWGGRTGRAGRARVPLRTAGAARLPRGRPWRRGAGGSARGGRARARARARGAFPAIASPVAHPPWAACRSVLGHPVCSTTIDQPTAPTNRWRSRAHGRAHGRAGNRGVLHGRGRCGGGRVGPAVRRPAGGGQRRPRPGAMGTWPGGGGSRLAAAVPVGSPCR